MTRGKSKNRIARIDMLRSREAMSEPLQKRRLLLLEKISRAADEIRRIDERLDSRRPGARALWAKENVTHDGLG